jgi:nicotinamide N-methyltransferase
MDRTLPSVAFSHSALRGPGEVTVRQNLASPSAEEEGTARWVWPGATATARWLCDRDRGRWLENKHVLELGSGTGLLGLVAARLGAASVTLTDLPSELHLLRANVARNEKRAAAFSAPTFVKPLVWGDEAGILELIDARPVPGFVPGFDVVLCCDLVYRNGDETQRALARTMRAALGTQPTNDPAGSRVLKARRAVVAYQFRENVLADAPFFEEVDRLFADPHKHDDGNDEDPWLFEYEPKDA